MAENNDLKMTGERVVPEDIKTLEEYLGLLRHMFVYEHVREQLKPSDRVLEIGFGEGYGTSLLSSACGDIVALDVEQGVVDYANRKYGTDKCQFQYYDGNELPFEGGAFSVVVSFQVIEHVVDDIGYVSEICRVLGEKGRSYLTTPNRETRLRPGQRPWNRFHIREYHQAGLAELLEKHFAHVDVRGISACDEIMRLEAKRVHQGPLLRLVLGLGLRKLIPGRLDPLVARIVGRLRGQQRVDRDGPDFKERFSMRDFRVETEDVAGSLDLYAICRKS